MSKITLNPERIGNITSSKSAKLFGAKIGYDTYIDGLRRELKLCRSLDVEAYARVMAWGELMERRVNDLLGLAYKSTGHTSIHHPNKSLRWGGSPDVTNQREKICCEIKGYQPDNFSWFTDLLLKAKEADNPAILKDECPDEYWQAVSNCCILQYDTIEMISYMPKESELPEIADLAANWPDENKQWRYKFVFDSISNGNLEEVAYLPEESVYESLNVYRFRMPEADAKLLYEKVLEATALINVK